MQQAIAKSAILIPSSSKYLFSFAVIADLQYANQPNSKSFLGVDRYHRNAMRQIERLFEHLKHDENAPENRFLFGIHMGDLLDLTTKNARHDMHTILTHFDNTYGRRVFHMTANHDFYNMPRSDVLDFFGINVEQRDSLLDASPTEQTESTSSSITTDSSHDTLKLIQDFSSHHSLDWDNFSESEYNAMSQQIHPSIDIAPPEHLLHNKHNWIWDQDTNKILRRKASKIAHLPKTLAGWQTLNHHEKRLLKRESKFIQELNRALEKYSTESVTSEQYSPKDDTLAREGHYSFTVDNFRFIVLDTYDISILAWPENHPNRKMAEEIIKKYHPEGVSTSINSSDHLEGELKRFVAFNGGIGEKQLKWLEQQLYEAEQANQRVIICSHVPFLPADDRSSAFLWNYKECLDVIHNSVKPGVVVACLSGHAHRGGYQILNGIHHITFEGSVESMEDCFAEIFVFPDKLELLGHGVVQSRVLPFAPESIDGQ